MSSKLFDAAEDGLNFNWLGGRAAKVSELNTIDALQQKSLAAMAAPGPQLVSMSVAFDVLLLMEFDTPIPFEPVPAADQFKVTVNGALAAISQVTVAENGYTLVLVLEQPVSPGAMVKVAYSDVSEGDDAVTLQDYDGVDAASFEAQVTVEGDAPPAPQLASMSVLFGELVLLEFDAPLPFEPLPSADQFQVRVNGALAAIARVSVAENGHTLVLTLQQPVRDGALVSVTYNDVSEGDDDITLQGMNGADVADFTAEARAGDGTGEETAPALTSMSVRDDKIILAFDAAIDGEALPSADQFTIHVDGLEQVVTAVEINADGALVLTLAEPVSPGAMVGLAYADRSEQDDPQTLQGQTGVDVADFSAEATAAGAAPALAAMSVRGARVTLTFDADLDAEATPSIEQFVIGVDGETAQIAELIVDGQSLILVLNEPVEEGAAVTFAYVDVSEEDDAATLQGADGVDIGDFTAEATASPAVPAMTAMTARGDQITLKFDAPLSTEALPTAEQFTLTIDGAAAAPAEIFVGPTGDVLVIRLAGPLVAGATVSLAYADVSEADDEQTLQGADGADVANFAVEGVAQAVGDGPKVVEAYADGDQVRLVFDHLLAFDHLPQGAAFKVMVGGQAVEVTGLSMGAAEHELVLHLSDAAAFGQDVTVSYADPTPLDDLDALETWAGVDADSFEGLAAQNLTAPVAPVLQSASISGSTLVLTYDATLDAAHGPDRNMFWVHVNGEQVAVSAVSVSGHNVTLRLGQSVSSGQDVRISYFDDTFGYDDERAVQSLDGADAMTVIDHQVVHGASSASLAAGGWADLI